MMPSAAYADFEKALRSMSDRFAAWQVWQDMIQCWATTIANAFDTGFRDAREKQFLALAEKYGEKYLGIFAELLGRLTSELEKNPFQDFLGGLFMNLGLGNHWKGQFFTPYSVCKCMAKIVMPDAEAQAQEKGYVTVYDPACGAGAILIAAADEMYAKGINYQQHAIFAAQDIDYTAALMCYVQLSLLGCAGYVHIGDTLTAPMTGHVLFGDGSADTWYTPMFFHETWRCRRMLKRIFGDSAPRTDAEKARAAEASQPELPAPPHQPRAKIAQKNAAPDTPPVFTITASGQVSMF